MMISIQRHAVFILCLVFPRTDEVFTLHGSVEVTEFVEWLIPVFPLNTRNAVRKFRRLASCAL